MFKEHLNDHIYYNVNLTNTDKTKTIRCAFESNRTQDILLNPSDYQFACERFSVPAIDIPIFIFRPNTYKVSLTAHNTLYEEFLQFIPNENSNLQWIWNYQEFIDIINKSYQNLFNQAKTAFPSILSTTAPYFVYNADDKIISSYAEINVNDPVEGLVVGMSSNLYVKLTSMPSLAYYDNPGQPISKTFTIVYQNLKNNIEVINGISYYKSAGEYSTLYTWNSITRLLFLTDSIPIASELVGNQKNITQKVLAEFVVPSNIDNRQSYQFFPQGEELLYYDLESTFPLSKIDVSVYWEDELGELYPLDLNYGENFSFKMLFKRKDIYINQL